MDLMKLAAKITLDDSGFNKGVSDAEKAGAKLTSKMSAMTVAVGNIAADMIKKGASAVQNVISGAINGYADYQQLIGGVETLFKDSAGKVARYAEQSYKTTGLSANQYMETVTSFSASLLQGLGGDTAQAAEIANMAVTDMADNANKMGTDISSIQAAYQGFAKQNYTMLDNLKLGYGGTREEMIRLINDSGILEGEIEDLDGITFDQLVQAIHKIQEQMGITGTTADEASETISGSKASLAAAWADFLASVGGDTDQKKLENAAANFETAFKTYVQKNLIPTISNTLKNTPELIKAVSDAITSLPADAITEMTSSGLDILTAGVEGATSIGKWLVDGLVQIFTDAKVDNSKITELGSSIGAFLGSAISTIVTNAGTIFEGIVAVGEGLASGLADGLFKGLFGEGSEVDKITKELDGSLKDANYEATKSGAIIQYMQTLVDKYGNAVKGTTEWKDAVSDLEQYIPNAGEVISNFGRDVQGAVDHLDSLAKKMREAAVNAALTEALQSSYSLLTKQNLEYNQEQARYNRNESQKGTYKDEIITALQQAAQAELDNINKQDQETPGYAELMSDQIAALEKFLQGKDEMGGDLKDLDLGSLWSALKAMGIDKVDGKGLDDYMKLFNEADAEMAAAQKRMGELVNEISATETVIADTEVAVQETMKSFSEKFLSSGDDAKTAIDGAGENAAGAIEEGGKKAGAGVETGGSAVARSLEEVAKEIGSVQIPESVGGAGNPDMPGFPGVPKRPRVPKANGMDFVPADGFKAELHRGEAVLTKTDAEKWRNGGGTAEVVGAIQDLNANIQNMQMVVGRKTFGRMVVNYGGDGLSGYIGRAESRDYAGYGS